MAIFVSWEVVEMTNSFCIEAPVAVAVSAQGHLDTRCLAADVTHCHGKLLCPEEPIPAGLFRRRAQLCAAALRAKNLQSFDAFSAGQPMPNARKTTGPAPEPQYSTPRLIHVAAA